MDSKLVTMVVVIDGGWIQMASSIRPFNHEINSMSNSSGLMIERNQKGYLDFEAKRIKQTHTKSLAERHQQLDGTSLTSSTASNLSNEK